VILAPGDRSDCFDLTWRAFNLADQLQTPVILLGDSYLSDNRESLAPFDLSRVTVDRGKLIAEGSVTARPEALDARGRYLRYKVTDDGVSWRALPGVSGAQQLVNSYEHDEFGYGAAGEDPDIRVAQNEKRLRKLKAAHDLVPKPAYFGAHPHDAEMSIVLFGSPKGPARQALEWLERDGHPVAIMQLVTLWPFPAAEVTAFLSASQRTMIVEGNATGQLEGLVAQETLRTFDWRLRRTDGRQFSPDQIYSTVLEVLCRDCSK
jgi:2-oxoglutarate ferredoxin oxidoreductase subunit alpha